MFWDEVVFDFGNLFRFYVMQHWGYRCTWYGSLKMTKIHLPAYFV